MLRDVQSRILCVSRDRLLAETRQLVLETRFSATAIYDLCEMTRLEGSFDLLILCHSLSAEECALSSLIARKNWPKVQVLALAINASKCEEGVCDQMLAGMPSPEALIKKVSSMLRTRESDVYDSWVAQNIEDWSFLSDVGQQRLRQMLAAKALVH